MERGETLEAYHLLPLTMLILFMMARQPRLASDLKSFLTSQNKVSSFGKEDNLLSFLLVTSEYTTLFQYHSSPFFWITKSYLYLKERLSSHRWEEHLSLYP